MFLDKVLSILKENDSSIAYTVKDEQYTYNELYKFISNIYSFLIKKNINKKPVIIYGHKDVYMKASFLACSFAGMAYVPIDSNMPKCRVIDIIDQINPNIIIGDIDIENSKIISSKKINKIMNNKNFEDIDTVMLKPKDIYYIIFTSGSTGTPKGVKVTYSNLNSCLNWLEEITKIHKGVVLNQASFSFDLSVADLYLSLITKSEQFVLEKDVQSNFKILFKYLKDSKANILVATPSFVDLLLLDKSFNNELMPYLKTILFCGEKLMPKTVEKIYSKFQNIKIINCYGPTECTFAVTSIELSRNKVYKDEIPIGKPKKDVKIFIVDEDMKVQEDNKVGEILISGMSVANGYVKKYQIMVS